MQISMRCPGCTTRFDFDSELEGKRIKCKSCGDIFRVEKPSRKPRDDDEDDRSRPAKRRDVEDEDDRPRPSKRRDYYDEDDRPRSSRWRDEDDDDRPSSRSRRAIVDDDDDRPRRTRDEDDDEAPPNKKSKTGLILILGGVSFLALVGIVVAVLFLRGKKGGRVDPGDIVKAPTKSCPIEAAERDISLLVIPDSGNTFGILRKTETFKKNWTFEPYDMASGRRTGKLEITGMDEPRAMSLTPDGKYLMAFTGASVGSEHRLLLWSLADGKSLTPDPWNPYPRDQKKPFDSSMLYRAEFVGNDKLATLSSARVMDVWPLPAFIPKLVDETRIAGPKELLGRDAPEKSDRYQRQLAFTADHSMVAVWNGDGYTFVRSVDGTETAAGATSSVKALAKEIWRNEPNDDFWIKAEGCAFSPDGKALAGIITSNWGGKKHALCIWDVQTQNSPVHYAVSSVQLREAPSIAWWGNRYIVTQGGKVEGMIIDVRSGLAKRQVMGPASLDHYGYGRDGRLWYVSSDDRAKPATVHVVDSLDPDSLTEAEDYEQIRELDEELYLRRLWLEPGGVLRKPTRYNPPLRERLIRWR
jgi:hypothetical protein